MKLVFQTKDKQDMQKCVRGGIGLDDIYRNLKYYMSHPEIMKNRKKYHVYPDVKAHIDKKGASITSSVDHDEKNSPVVTIKLIK